MYIKVLGFRVDANGEVKIFENSKKNVGGGVGSGARLGGQVGCDRRIAVLAKILFFLVGGGQGRCEQGIEVFVKIKKKKFFFFFFFWGGGRVRVDVNGEMKFCDNSKNNVEGGRVGGG